MEKRNFFATFFVLLLISFVIFVLGTTGILRPVAQSLYSVAKPLRSVLHISSSSQNDSELLTRLGKVSEQKSLEGEVKALRDQFDSGTTGANALLPARVIGAPSFIPGVSLPQTFILDKGEQDGVKKGMAGVFQNNLVGVITEVGSSFAELTLITNDAFSTTVKTGGALGVLKGTGGSEMVLGNVALSQNLEKNSLVYTKGSVSAEGVGILPDLILGRIISVDKKPSDLFQKANVKSALDMQRIDYVFLILR